MPNRRLRLTAVLAALSAAVLLAFATGASATVISSHITSPTDASFFLEDATKPVNTITISGTFKTDAPIEEEEEPEAEVRCYSGVEAAESLSEGEVEEGEFKKIGTNEYEFKLKEIAVEEFGEAPCVLRLVPSANTEPLLPGTATPFEGPRVADSEFRLQKDETVSSTTGYDFEARSLTSVFEIEAVGNCGLGPTQLVSSPLLTESAGLFECAGALYGEPLGATRADIQIDGLNAYDPAAADTILKAVKPANNPPSVTVEKVFEKANGLKSIHETDPLVICEGTTTAFPETGASCQKFASAGISLERVWTVSGGGRLITMTDTWHSTDGNSHRVSALYDQELGSDPASPGTYQFPGATAGFAATKAGESVGVAAGEGAILYRRNGTAAETVGGTHPVGAIVFDTSPSGPLQVRTGTADTKGVAGVLLMPYSLEVPAKGIRTLAMSFVQGYTLGEVCALAETVNSGCQPSVAITSPASGGTTNSSSIAVSGTASDRASLSSLKVNGQSVAVSKGAWTTEVPLTPGPNTITAVATNAAGLTRSATTSVTYTPTGSSFTVQAKQRISGEPGYTTSELSGELGETVEYEIVAHNTGATSLELGALDDPGCSAISPSGPQSLGVGQSLSYTCSHVLTSVASYSNEASLEGNEGTGKLTSNRLTVTVPAKPQPPGEEKHGTTPPPTTTPTPSPAPTIARSLGAPKFLKGNVTVVIACTGPAVAACSLRGTLVTVERLRGGRPSALSAAATKVVTVGSASATIAAGTTRTITIKLNATGRSLLARFHKLPARLAVVQQGVAKAGSSIVAQKLTILAKHR